MAPGISAIHQSLRKIIVISVLPCLVGASISDDIYNNYFAPAPAPQDGPPFSANALRDPKYLPVQIGAIIGAYVLSLVFVALGLLSLAKRRRDHLIADGQDEADAYAAALEQLCNTGLAAHPAWPEISKTPLARNVSGRKIPNFSYKSPTRSEFSSTANIGPAISPASTSAPGVDLLVDQSIVAADRKMAQNKLEEMYKHVMEHEEAKEKGLILEFPMATAGPAHQRRSAQSKKSKPESLDLHSANGEKKRSRASSFLSGLRSPRLGKAKGINISSPMMTPQTDTSPRQDGQEMDAIPPRHYAPAAPPPVPTDQEPFAGHARSSAVAVSPGPDAPTERIESIDGRLGVSPSTLGTAKDTLQLPTEVDGTSAVSEPSQSPIVGLPSSPKPGATFGSLASPKPGARFQRANPPSAVRTGGTLPLRAYEPALGSPSAMRQTTKQTVFERRGPLSPGGGRTPYTASAVPYSPYQPYTPCVPMTPSLVTKEDRKRIKKMIAKTPTVEMVQSENDVW